MTRGADQIALGGATVAAIIVIGSADGRYEPFDAILGVVLAILLACFYRPPRAATWVAALRQSAAAAAVFALILCVIVAPVLDAAAAPPAVSDAAELRVDAFIYAEGVQSADDQLSRELLWTWVVAFLTLGIIAFGWARRPRRPV